MLTVEPTEPRGYGRIVRSDSGAITAIVEEKDATAAQRAIREVYTGAMAAPTAALKRWLAALSNDNAAGEYYLTDVVERAVAAGAAGRRRRRERTRPRCWASTARRSSPTSSAAFSGARPSG